MVWDRLLDGLRSRILAAEKFSEARNVGVET